MSLFAVSLQVSIQLSQDIKYKVLLAAHCELFLQINETKAKVLADEVLHKDHLLGCEQLRSADENVGQK